MFVSGSGRRKFQSNEAPDKTQSLSDGVAASYRATGARLLGKVALISCGDAAVSDSVARHFALEGARIVLCNAIDPAHAQRLCRAITDGGGTCQVLSDDCDGRDACRRLVEKVVAQFGALDVLVNCASIDVQPGDDRISQIEATFRNSAFAYLYLMTSALPYLPKEGSIVNVSSLSTVNGHSDPDHDAAASAIDALTQSFAKSAAARGVRVNAISRVWHRNAAACPAINGGDMRSANEPWEGDAGSTCAGSTCVFLASRDSALISGQTFHLHVGGNANG